MPESDIWVRVDDLIPIWVMLQQSHGVSVAAARLSFASAQLSRLGDPSGLKAELS